MRAAGPWFPYLRVFEGVELLDHRVDCLAAVAAAAAAVLSPRNTPKKKLPAATAQEVIKASTIVAKHWRSYKARKPFLEHFRRWRARRNTAAVRVQSAWRSSFAYRRWNAIIQARSVIFHI
jgi:hypothetical protein